MRDEASTEYHRFAPIQLIILEPRLQSDSALPIMPPQPKPTTPSQARSKRVPIIDGLRWMLGPNSVGTISPESKTTPTLVSAKILTEIQLTPRFRLERHGIPWTGAQETTTSKSSLGWRSFLVPRILMSVLYESMSKDFQRPQRGNGPGSPNAISCFIHYAEHSTIPCHN